MSSSNSQGLFLVAVIFAIALGTVLYINFFGGGLDSEFKERGYPNLNHPEVPKPTEDSLKYYNEERKSIIDCENMVPPELQAPRFLGSIPNVTLSKGENVSMTCVAENLGSYRMAWLRLQSQSILTIHNQIITRNMRVGLSMDSRTLETPCKNRSIQTTITMYTLHINSVQSNDEGYYMCQMNTDPMKGQWGFLKVEDADSDTAV